MAEIKKRLGNQNPTQSVIIPYSTINGQEASAIKYITSNTAKEKSILKDVDVAINHCSKINQIILFYRYIKFYPDWKVAQKTGYK